jgi:predicted RNA binding protein YcfA (HicA-like mRNA interferase family)
VERKLLRLKGSHISLKEDKETKTLLITGKVPDLIAIYTIEN